MAKQHCMQPACRCLVGRSCLACAPCSCMPLDIFVEADGMGSLLYATLRREVGGAPAELKACLGQGVVPLLRVWVTLRACNAEILRRTVE